MAKRSPNANRCVTFKSKGLTVEAYIYVNATVGTLTRDEVNEVADAMADNAMHAIVGAPYVPARLSKIKVRR